MGSVLCPSALRDTDPLLPQSRPRRSCRVQGLTLNWAGLFPRNLSSRFISAELYWISLGRNNNGGKVFSWDRKANRPVWEEKGRGGTRRSECVVISEITHKTCPFLDFLPALSVCRYTCAHDNLCHPSSGTLRLLLETRLLTDLDLQVRWPENPPICSFLLPQQWGCQWVPCPWPFTRDLWTKLFVPTVACTFRPDPIVFKVLSVLWWKRSLWIMVLIGTWTPHDLCDQCHVKLSHVNWNVLAPPKGYKKSALPFDWEILSGDTPNGIFLEGCSEHCLKRLLGPQQHALCPSPGSYFSFLIFLLFSLLTKVFSRF